MVMVAMIPLLSSWIAWSLRVATALSDPYLVDTAALSYEVPDRAPEAGIASRYGEPGDKYGAQALACAPGKHVDSTMHVCAHRTRRCGTILFVRSVKTRQTTLCRVMDRGPFCALDKNGVWHVEVRLKEGSRRRGFLDLTPAAYRDLGLRGLDPVEAWAVYVPAKPLRVRRPAS